MAKRKNEERDLHPEQHRDHISANEGGSRDGRSRFPYRPVGLPRNGGAFPRISKSVQMS